MAHVSEEDYPFMPAEGTFTVDEIVGGFRVQKLGGTASKTRFECKSCGKEITR